MSERNDATPPRSDFDKWWDEYTRRPTNEVLSEYEKDVARDAWNAALENYEPDDNFPLTD